MIHIIYDQIFHSYDVAYYKKNEWTLQKASLAEFLSPPLPIGQLI